MMNPEFLMIHLLLMNIQEISKISSVAQSTSRLYNGMKTRFGQHHFFGHGVIILCTLPFIQNYAVFPV